MSGGHVTSASACYSTCADMSSVQLNVNSLLHPYGDACKCVCVCVKPCLLRVFSNKSTCDSSRGHEEPQEGSC